MSAPRPTMVWSDFGGVLTSPIDEALDRVLAAAGLPEHAFLDAVRRVADDLAPHTGCAAAFEALERGRVSQAEWGRRVTAALAPDLIPRIDLTSFGDHWYTDRRIDTHLLAELHALRQQGTRIGLLTNSVAEWEPHRRALLHAAAPHLFPGLFDTVIASHVCGLSKPDPRILAHAERVAGVVPRQCLLIDDVAANCAAARARGWRAIHHVAAPTTVAALAALLASDAPSTGDESGTGGA
ncbi:HAD-IA family hydrolase (plasmid) [Embleya sp. NBC_00888]|uniref:HAD-IA family hydrolase n=1 Tax=Embleya sp. NBC_00888 TaxID=2975960 RepID=UPI002F919519|nr:HAD-IA family hydrolase [Embleya sp. NBC_00888]